MKTNHHLFSIFFSFSLIFLTFDLFSQEKLAPQILEEKCARVSAEDLCVTIQFAGGRLGNQLFEVATALSIAKDNNCTAVFPMFTTQERWEKMKTYGVSPDTLFSDYINADENHPDPIFSKRRLGITRDETLLQCFEKNSVLEPLRRSREHYKDTQLPALFQPRNLANQIFKAGRIEKGWGAFNYMSHKIFHHNERYLQKILGPSKKQKRELQSKFRQLGLKIKNKTIVSIHYRQGDRARGYIGLGFAPVGIRYYKAALARMDLELSKISETVDKYVVFSDDPEAAENFFTTNFPDKARDHKFFFINFRRHKQKDYEDVWLMSMAEHNIIANSTFSWLGAYLNKNPEKIVIRPKHWWFYKVRRIIKYSENAMSPPDWISLQQF